MAQSPGVETRDEEQESTSDHSCKYLSADLDNFSINDWAIQIPDTRYELWMLLLAVLIEFVVRCVWSNPPVHSWLAQKLCE